MWTSEAPAWGMLIGMGVIVVVSVLNTIRTHVISATIATLSFKTDRIIQEAAAIHESTNGNFNDQKKEIASLRAELLALGSLAVGFEKPKPGGSSL